MKNKIPAISTIILFLCLLTQTAAAVGIPDAFRQWGAGIASNDQSTPATFALGATADNSKSFPSAFTAEQKIDVLADFRPSAAHVGKNAAIYLLARYNATWYMKNAANQWVAWNGKLASLVANGPARPLKALETLAVELQLSGLSGNFEVFVGYRLDDLIFYNRKPLSFVINKALINQFPLVNAGSDTSYDEGSQIALLGSKSRDPDGSIVKYQWEQLTGSPAVLLYSDASKYPDNLVKLPLVDSDEILQFKLTVTDNQGAVASAIVKIAVRDMPLRLLPEPSCTVLQILQNGVCINTYTLSYSAGANGSITGNASQTVNHGANGTAVTAVPATGYHFVSWSDGVLTASRTDSNVTADKAVTASFSINTYKLSYSAGSNGSIMGNASQTVNYGTNGTQVNAVSAAYYHFVQWSDGSLLNPRNDLNVTGAITVTASFDLNWLNDTGINQCTDSLGYNLACPLATFPGQDAESGRDSNASYNSNSDGHKGFSFTKIGSNGQALANQAVAWNPSGSEAAGSQWSCVKDNVTGLMWEVKTNDNGLHDKDWTYTWYSSDNSNNGGDPGYQNTSNCGGSQCNTAAYAAAVNSAGWCGYSSGWRLPTIDELKSLVSLDQFSLTIDSNYFPNTQGSLFWSSSPVAFNSSSAWFIFFDNGSDFFDPVSGGRFAKSSSFYVRLVRSGQ